MLELGSGQRLGTWISWICVTGQCRSLHQDRCSLATALLGTGTGAQQGKADHPRWAICSVSSTPQRHSFSSYLRTCSSWWDKQYVWSTRAAVQLSREMMLYEVSSCAAIWRESHLTILGDCSFLSQNSDPIHWKWSIFIGLKIAYSTAPFLRWRKFSPLFSDSSQSYWKWIA